MTQILLTIMSLLAAIFTLPIYFSQRDSGNPKDTTTYKALALALGFLVFSIFVSPFGSKDSGYDSWPKERTQIVETPTGVVVIYNRDQSSIWVGSSVNKRDVELVKTGNYNLYKKTYVRIPYVFISSEYWEIWDFNGNLISKIKVL